MAMFDFVGYGKKEEPYVGIGEDNMMELRTEKRIKKEFNSLKKLFNNNKHLLGETFNYKLYNVFYHGNLDLHGMEREDVVYCNLDRMYLDYVSELSYFERNKSGAETKLVNIGRTSSMYLEPLCSDYYVYDSDLYFDTGCNYIYDATARGSLSELMALEDYEFIAVVDGSSDENDDYCESVAEELEDLTFKFLGMVQTYHFIQQYEAMVDDPISFQREIDRYLTPEDLVSGMKIDDFTLEDLEYEYDLIVKRAGKYAKVWVSLAKQPIMVTTYWGEDNMAVAIAVAYGKKKYLYEVNPPWYLHFLSWESLFERKNH